MYMYNKSSDKCHTLWLRGHLPLTFSVSLHKISWNCEVKRRRPRLRLSTVVPINGGTEGRDKAAMGGAGSCSLGGDCIRQCLHLPSLLPYPEIGSGFEPAPAHHDWRRQRHRRERWPPSRLSLWQVPSLGCSLYWCPRLLLWLWCSLACCQPYCWVPSVLAGKLIFEFEDFTHEILHTYLLILTAWWF